jgi:2-keto-4-pentenoate hydratase/2-oxohepta-3-ene-1,7-dioic acid hydratase in catechol pathway
MRIVTFTPASAPTAAPRAGALLPDGQHLLNFAVAVDASAEVPLLTWYDLDDEWLRKARQVHDQLAQNMDRRETLPRGAVVPLRDVVLGPPVPRPGKVICIGLNYRDHAAESGMAVPESPVTFSKYVTAVTGPERPIVLPAASTQVDYEAELAVVIGRRAKHVPVERAWDCVLGYTNLNDVSARDMQFADKQWQRGKSCDTFAPMGPAIVTADEVGDPHRLRVQLRLNGRTMQDSSTEQLIFGVDRVVSFLSQTVTLEPGDVIATGTPPGVGFARKPPVFLKAGDVVEVEVEKLGVLRNPVVEEPSRR